jgi:hypothetical protein
MNPLTVALQGAATLAVLVALRIAGHPLAAAIVGGSLLVIGLLFQVIAPPKYSGGKPRFADLPPITFALLGLVPMILAVTAPGSPSGKHHLGHHVADVLLALAIGAACVYTSSLIDTYIVSPQLRGDRASRPCCESKDASWRPLTQLWLLHRVLAYLAVRISLGAVVLIVVVASIHKPSTAVTSVIVAVSSLVAGYVLNRATPIFVSAINPPFYVGDKVWLVEEYAAGDKPQTCYYAVDVSIDGVGLLEITDSNDPFNRDPTQDPEARMTRTHDRLVPIGDMSRLLRSRRTFSACAPGSGCRHVNKYCPDAQKYWNGEPAAGDQQPPPAGSPDPQPPATPDA